jgi:hypothetical protein
MTRTEVCFLAGWTFWKKLCVVNAGPDTQLRFHTVSGTPAENWIKRAENAERKMYLKLTMLFLLIGFVAGLPYVFEKIWTIWKSEVGNRHH